MDVNEQWHRLHHDEVRKKLRTSASGLTESEAGARLAIHGRNEITDAKRKSTLRIALRQFSDLMILILGVAAAISAVVGELTDAIVILVIILLNAVIGFVQEIKAEKAMEALRSMAAGSATVMRDGKTSVVPSHSLVPGDLVILEAGNVVPADLRLFESQRLKTDESTLTGESADVEKNTDVLPEGDHTLGDRLNLGFKGTSVTTGRGSGYVVATGMNTELGKIATMVGREDKPTPLQARLSDFSKRLSVIVLAICAIFFFVGWLRGEALVNLLLVSISLAVAAIPEALPALVTVGLAFGARRMARSKALVRNLHAVETLGSVTHICSDKTGTLTMNQMTVQAVWRPESNDRLSGLMEEHDTLLAAMALNNDVSQTGDGRFAGDSTEVAIAEYAAGERHIKEELLTAFPRVAELPFDSDRKLMTTMHHCGSRFVVITKGAVDVLTGRMSANSRKDLAEIERQAGKLAGGGQRVLGFAMKALEKLPPEDRLHEIEADLEFIGIAGIADPPRKEAADAVATCRQAGMKPVMITGDHKLTAAAIAETLGITDQGDEAISGTELAAMTEEEFSEKAERITVYARVSPAQKLGIITTLQERGHVVAMTGDGVNDAPALKAADIGVAMGLKGTEVAREASDMILLDDNFATIVKAVEQGRRIFDNILKFVKYIMTGNTGELWAILLAPFFGLPIPLLPIQILWVNLVTDGLPGIALASEVAEPDIMKRRPFPMGRSIFAGGMGFHILWVGFLIGMLTLGTYAWGEHHNIECRQTMAFTVLCFCQLSHVTAIRSQQPFFRSRFFANGSMIFALLFTFLLQLAIVYVPALNGIFHTQRLTAAEFLICVAISGIVFAAVEVEKLVKIKTGSMRAPGSLRA